MLVSSGPIVGQAVAARERFLGEAMRLTAGLVDEMGGEIEPTPVAGQTIELDQREFDFLAAGIAALPSGPPAESGRDMIDVSLHQVEKPPPTRRPKVGDRPFQQMAGVAEFVVVAQVRPALVGLTSVAPTVQIAVGRLGLGEIVDDRVDLRFNFGVAPVRQRAAGRFDPFADLGTS